MQTHRRTVLIPGGLGGGGGFCCEACIEAAINIVRRISDTCGECGFNRSSSESGMLNFNNRDLEGILNHTWSIELRNAVQAFHTYRFELFSIM